MYADKITDSMRKTIDETNRRRLIQEEHNHEHGITPTQIRKTTEQILKQTKVADGDEDLGGYEYSPTESIAADPVISYMSTDQLEKTIKKVKKDMESAAKKLDFIEAARLRDEMFELKKRL